MIIFKILLVLVYAQLACFSQTSSDPVQKLAEKVRSGATTEALEMILTAGRSGNKEYIPFLKGMAEPQNASYAVKTVPSYAQIALAMLGADGYLSLIINEVDSPDIFLQNAGIQRLSIVGGPAAFKVFRRLLDDTSTRREVPSAQELANARANHLTIKAGDEILEPRSILVMRRLAEMVDDPPLPLSAMPTEADIGIWKAWFERHPEVTRPK